MPSDSLKRADALLRSVPHDRPFCQVSSLTLLATQARPSLVQLGTAFADWGGSSFLRGDSRASLAGRLICYSSAPLCTLSHKEQEGFECPRNSETHSRVMATRLSLGLAGSLLHITTACRHVRDRCRETEYYSLPCVALNSVEQANRLARTRRVMAW